MPPAKPAPGTPQDWLTRARLGRIAHPLMGLSGGAGAIRRGYSPPPKYCSKPTAWRRR